MSDPQTGSPSSGYHAASAADEEPAKSTTPKAPRASKKPQLLTPESIASDDVNDADDSRPPIPMAFKPISFAKPTAIQIDRDGIRKPGGTPEAKSTGRGRSLSLIKKAAGSLYRYRRLKDDEVRVLIVKAGASNDPLNATLLTLNDNHIENGSYKYAALSYNWGEDKTENSIIIQDDIGSAPITSIQALVDGAMGAKGLGAKRLLITPNLSDALKRLRQEDQPLLIWVDALCINQNDEVEKQEQVKKMDLIYRNAYNVCIWLGSDDPKNPISDMAMTFIPQVIEPSRHRALLHDSAYLPQWAIYRDFMKWVVYTSNSLDIICRHWALPERQTKTPTTPRLVELPSYIQLVDNSAFGRGAEVFDGRNAGDSFVGRPGDNIYHASGSGREQKFPQVKFPNISKKIDAATQDENETAAPVGGPPVNHDMSLVVTGVCMGKVSFRNQPFADGVIPKECLEKLGWSFDWHATSVESVPEQLWQTLVAEKGPNGTAMPHFYRRACQHCLVNLTRNGHINIESLLQESENGSYVMDYLERVKAVTWDRSFIEACPLKTIYPKSSDGSRDKLVGLGPPKTRRGDLIVVIYGCSVPVILRPMQRDANDIQGYEFIGEAYIYGKMDGEAIEDNFDEQKFRLI
ncbi:HET-domain-containing protein [Setomelanomma holmii]|uniref:HET-domain-containing protein n=1 Tax=Setomelanomma holmii TaxID=210430 RepID=A0A9P4HB93_9PLEO|nr:HET-domain-containing protein [Setomelanomma holmii]